MRLLASIFLLSSSCWAQSDQAQLAALLKQMERAEQTGDFNTWLGLWSREKSAEMEKMRPYVRPRPDQQYRATKIFAHGDEAALLAQAGPRSFLTMRLRREGDQWRIRDQVWRDSAPDPNSVYALVPPDPGAFAREGSPWDQIAPAMDPRQAARLRWQMRAVFDESYLYVRIESDDGFPAPGSTLQQPPSGWPVFKIGVSGVGEFVLFDSVNIGDQATFDKHGQANSHRPYAAYLLRLERNDREIFSAWAALDPSPLVEAAGRYFDMRIPLRTMGILDSRALRMIIGDAQWPKSVLVSVEIPRFPH